MKVFLRIDLLEVPYGVLFLFLEGGLCGFLEGFLGSCELQVMIGGFWGLKDFWVLRGNRNEEEKLGRAEGAIVFFFLEGATTNNNLSVLSYYAYVRTYIQIYHFSPNFQLNR